MKAIAAVVAFLVYFLFFNTAAFAVTITIPSFPSTITDDLFTLTASISGATAGTNYLRVDIFKDGTTNYFGETFNSTDWYGGSTYSQYLPITIVGSATWSGTLQGRVGSPTSTQYDGTGTYKIRLRRYTSGGGYTASEANNSAVTVAVSLPTPTPTSSPTSTPTSTSILTQTTTPTVTKTPTPTPTFSSSSSAKIQAVLATEASELSASSLPTDVHVQNKEEVKTLGTEVNRIPQILFGIGVVFFGSCGIVAFWIYRKNKIEEI